jgi:hypothetical protein
MKKWSVELDTLTAEFIEDFGSLSPTELNWKMHPDTWSIGQNIEHLIIINESYFPTLDSLRADSQKLPFIAKFGFIVNSLGKAILKASGPERRKKMKTFPMWSPSKNEFSGDILKRFQKQQEVLKSHIENSGDLIDKGIVISSPANKMIVYKLETAFDIIVAHEKRHLEQAREVLSAINHS